MSRTSPVTETDIVVRLRRSTDPFWHHERPELVWEAAGEIESLREELESAKAQVHIALHSNGFQLLGVAQTEQQPVAWRWRPRGGTLWIYNPEIAWLDDNRDKIEAEPLFTHADSSTDRGGKDPLAGLVERLDRLCLTSTEDNRSFILATESARNIVEIVREWIRSDAGARHADTSTLRHGACQVCGEPADLTCGPSRFGDKTWACKDCWEPDTRPDRGGTGDR